MITLDGFNIKDDEIDIAAMGNVQVPENPYKQKLDEDVSVIETSIGSEAVTTKELLMETEILNKDTIIKVEQKLSD